MTHSQKRSLSFAIPAAVICLASLAFAQQNKTPGSPVTGHYEGTAKDRAENVITVALDLTEKDGALSGMINSSHGDFAISGGSRKGDDVTLEFDAGGPVGTLTLRRNGDQLVGTWDAGDDGGPVDVKKVAAKQDPPKGKS